MTNHKYIKCISARKEVPGLNKQECDKLADEKIIYISSLLIRYFIDEITLSDDIAQIKKELYLYIKLTYKKTIYDMLLFQSDDKKEVSDLIFSVIDKTKISLCNNATAGQNRNILTKELQKTIKNYASGILKEINNLYYLVENNELTFGFVDMTDYIKKIDEILNIGIAIDQISYNRLCVARKKAESINKTPVPVCM